jgi:uncharacterized damage-inducible protein DinB
MDVSALLLELYGRIPPLAKRAVEGIDLPRLSEPPAPGANTIAWLIWHLARVQDHHVAELLDDEQIWVGGNWARRFSLTPDPANTGYGHSTDDAGAVRPEDPEVLLEYLEAVQHRTTTMLQSVTPEALERIVDRRWDPPVTLGVRLVSIVDDSLQHAGQAAYIRGLLRL